MSSRSRAEAVWLGEEEKMTKFEGPDPVKLIRQLAFVMLLQERETG